METDKFLVTNIRQYLNSDNPKLGEDKLLQELSGFSCPKNWDIENYLKKNAIEFTKKNQPLLLRLFAASVISSASINDSVKLEHDAMYSMSSNSSPFLISSKQISSPIKSR